MVNSVEVRVEQQQRVGHGVDDAGRGKAVGRVGLDPGGAKGLHDAVELLRLALHVDLLAEITQGAEHRLASPVEQVHVGGARGLGQGAVVAHPAGVAVRGEEGVGAVVKVEGEGVRVRHVVDGRGRVWGDEGMQRLEGFGGDFGVGG